jgi:hypothetical protein
MAAARPEMRDSSTWKHPMFKKSEWPAHEWEDRLNALLTAAARAGVTQATIASTLQQHVDAIRVRAAVTANLGVVPKTHSGNSRRP